MSAWLIFLFVTIGSIGLEAADVILWLIFLFGCIGAVGIESANVLLRIKSGRRPPAYLNSKWYWISLPVVVVCAGALAVGVTSAGPLLTALTVGAAGTLLFQKMFREHLSGEEVGVDKPKHPSNKRGPT